MKQAITKTVKTGIATSIANRGLNAKYPWLNSPEDFNFEPIVNIAHKIYDLTGLTLSGYTLESDDVINWRHTLIFPFNSAFPHELNMSTLVNTLKTAVTSEFGDVSVVLKGVGMNIRLIIII